MCYETPLYDPPEEKHMVNVQSLRDARLKLTEFS